MIMCETHIGVKMYNRKGFNITQVFINKISVQVFSIREPFILLICICIIVYIVIDISFKHMHYIIL